MSDESAAGKSEAPPGTRRPYERPAVSWEEAMEVRKNLMALCDKISTDVSCQSASNFSS